MARTYTKSSKMNTSTEFPGFVTLEEMEFFPSFDLALPLEYDDVFQEPISVKDRSQEFAAGDILNDLPFEGGDNLLGTNWLTDKFDFSDFDPSLANTSETLQDLANGEDTPFESSIPDLNVELLTPLTGEELLSIDMPPTPEQKVPEYTSTLSPYSVPSPGIVLEIESSPSSPSSLHSDSGNESNISLIDLLTKETAISFSPSKENSKSPEEPGSNFSQRGKPYARPLAKLPVKPKGKSPAQKQRKRVQNKDAATRYRVKKRSEQDELFEKAEGIEKENTQLRNQLSAIGKEVEYLKNLLLEVYETRKKTRQQSV